MEKRNRKISAGAVAADIQCGLSNQDLMSKYGLTTAELQRVFTKLADRCAVDRSELDKRLRPAVNHAKTKLSAKAVLDDINLGASDDDIMAKYGLSRKGLDSLFNKLIGAGLLSRSDIEVRRSQTEGPPADLSEPGPEAAPVGTASAAAFDSPPPQAGFVPTSPSAPLNTTDPPPVSLEDDGRPEPPLIAAWHSGHYWRVEFELNNGAGTEVTDKEGATVLILAAKKGRWNIARLLLRKGADVHARDRFGKTAWDWASENGHTKVLKILADHLGVPFPPPNLSAKGPPGDVQEPGPEAAPAGIGSAAVSGSPLPQSGFVPTSSATPLNTTGPPPVSLEDDGRPEPPLIAAWHSGDYWRVKRVLNDGVGTEVTDKDGATVLILAAKEGRWSILRSLLRTGADVHARDRFGKTAWDWASENGHTKVLKILADHLGVPFPPPNLSAMVLTDPGKPAIGPNALMTAAPQVQPEMSVYGHAGTIRCPHCSNYIQLSAGPFEHHRTGEGPPSHLASGFAGSQDRPAVFFGAGPHITVTPGESRNFLEPGKTGDGSEQARTAYAAMSLDSQPVAAFTPPLGDATAEVVEADLEASAEVASDAAEAVADGVFSLFSALFSDD